MDINVKVAGTTFHPIPAGKFVAVTETFEKEGTSCAKCMAILMPEPENEYDHEAVKVLVKLTDGSAFHLGYIPKDVPLKKMVKTMLVSEMEIRDYGEQYNPSFLLTAVNGL